MLLLLATGSKAQYKTLVASVTNTGNEAVEGASALLLNAADSFIIDHVRSDAQGGFTLQARDTGRYILFIS